MTNTVGVEKHNFFNPSGQITLLLRASDGRMNLAMLFNISKWNTTTDYGI